MGINSCFIWFPPLSRDRGEPMPTVDGRLYGEREADAKSARNFRLARWMAITR
jgi:hypothetical protein